MVSRKIKNKVSTKRSRQPLRKYSPKRVKKRRLLKHFSTISLAMFLALSLNANPAAAVDSTGKEILNTTLLSTNENPKKIAMIKLALQTVGRSLRSRYMKVVFVSNMCAACSNFREKGIQLKCFFCGIFATITSIDMMTTKIRRVAARIVGIRGIK